MHVIPKTVFSEMTALMMAGFDELVEIQSHGETVGYFMAIEAYQTIDFAIRQALMSLEEGYDAPKIREDLRAARDLLNTQGQGG
jgi:hypothetical protein